MRMHRTMAATATLALALGGAALAAPAAQAAATTSGSLVRQDGELWYKAAAGQTNHLTVSEKIESRGDYEEYFILTFHDDNDITIDAQAAEWNECVYPSADDHTTVQCAVLIPQNSDDSDSYDIDLGDGDDTVKLGADSSAYAGVHGGAGDDVLQGSAADVFWGEDGDDTIDGGGGIMSFGAYGGEGDDTITNCTGECHGDAGNDTLSGNGEDNILWGTTATTSCTAARAGTPSTAARATTSCSASRATTRSGATAAMTCCGAARATTPSPAVRAATRSTRTDRPPHVPGDGRPHSVPVRLCARAPSPWRPSPRTPTSPRSCGTPADSPPSPRTARRRCWRRW